MVVVGINVQSCGDPDPDDIKVTPTSINLASNANSTATFGIVYSGNWSISDVPGWLQVSSTSGNGNSQITLTAMSDNTTSFERECMLVVNGGGSSASISVKQAKMADIQVNPSSLSLTSVSNSFGEFSIEYAGNWEITNKPDWLNLSSSNGKGNTKITVTAISANNSASPRECILQVTGGALSTHVTVSQLPGLATGCEVEFYDSVILYNSYAMKVAFGRKAAYYYVGCFDESYANYTDERILEALMKDKEPLTVDGDDIVLGSGYPGEKCIQCVVVLDKDRNRGELYRKEVVLPVPANNPPQVFISDIRYTDTLWKWDTTLGATAQEYYMVAFEGYSATLVWDYFPDAYIAMLIKDSFTPEDSFIQSGSWQMTRNADNLYVATWAKRDNKWSDVLTTWYGEISSDTRSVSNMKQKNTLTGKNASLKKSVKEFNKLKKHIKMVKISD